MGFYWKPNLLGDSYGFAVKEITHGYKRVALDRITNLSWANSVPERLYRSNCKTADIGNIHT